MFFDLRLLPLAIGLWLGAGAVCLTAGAELSRSIVVALIAGFGFPVGLWFGSAVIKSNSHRTIALAERPATQLVAGLVTKSTIAILMIGLFAGSAVALVRVAPLHSEPLNSIAMRGQSIQGQARLLEVPKSKSRADGITDQPEAITWWVQADLVKLHDPIADLSYTMSLPISLRGMASNSAVISKLVPGTVVSFSGTAQPGLAGRPQAANILVKTEPQVAEPAPIWQQWGAKFRASMRAVSADIDSPGGKLLPGLVVGDESQLDDQLLQSMRDTGLSHLTAVSGSNIAVVTGLVLALGFGLRLPRLLALGLAFIAMLGFVVVVGPQASVLRATAMATVVLATLMFKRDRDTIPSLLVSVTALLLIDPWLSVSLGFALSVSATTGIIVAGKIYEQSDRDLRAKLKAVVIVTVAAQIATTPIIAGMGNGIPLIGVLANLLAMPAVSVATVVGLAAAGVGLIHFGLGTALAQLAAILAQWIASVAEYCAKVPGGLVAWPGGILSAMLASLITVLLLTVVLRYRKLGLSLSASVVVLMLIAAQLYTADPLQLHGRWLPANWAVVVCDVGQGDASVIKTGPGHAIVIDVGPSDEPTAACLSELKITTIDLLVLTHFHADHVGGLAGALTRRTVTRVVGSPLPDPPGQTARVQKILSQYEIPLVVARPGQAFTIAGVTIEFLWPFELVSGQGSDPNNASVTAKVTTAGITILFPGDVEQPAQDRIIDRIPPVNVDIIKVPHHGSKNQSSRLPEWAHAKWAIMSAGVGNRYGHPSQKAIDMFADFGTKVARTDTMGAIAIVPSVSGQVTPTGAASGDPDIMVKGIEGRADP